MDTCYPLAAHFQPVTVFFSFFSLDILSSFLIFSTSLQQLDIQQMELTAITKAREDTLYHLSSRISSDPGEVKIKDYLKIVRKVRMGGRMGEGKQAKKKKKERDLFICLFFFLFFFFFLKLGREQFFDRALLLKILQVQKAQRQHQQHQPQPQQLQHQQPQHEEISAFSVGGEGREREVGGEREREGVAYPALQALSGEGGGGGEEGEEGEGEERVGGEEVEKEEEKR